MLQYGDTKGRKIMIWQNAQEPKKIIEIHKKIWNCPPLINIWRSKTCKKFEQHGSWKIASSETYKSRQVLKVGTKERNARKWDSSSYLKGTYFFAEMIEIFNILALCNYL